MTGPQDPVAITADTDRIVDFARSEVFERTYRDGMMLVEEMAAYLDGPGRAAARTLPRMAALAYAGETMRLTTRLMQVASWLMVQRAVREGEMSAEDARLPKYRMSERPGPKPDAFVSLADLPEALRVLAERSDALFNRVVRLDAGMHQDREPTGMHSQLAKLHAAFGAD